MKKYFWFFVSLIILFGFISRVYILHGNNLYFTADQGRDAVYVRQIINYHQIFTKGPESSVRGIFTGPLWYYFISLGFAALNGNPAGAVLMLILLNLGVTTILMKEIKKEVDWKIALITGFGLQIFWPFFSTSLYGFNPFPLVSISILLMTTLNKTLAQNTERNYFFGLILIFLAFNTELAGATAFLIFYIFVGIYLVLYKKLTRLKFYIFALLAPGIGAAKIAVDFLREPKTVNNGLKVLAGTNFIQIAEQFIKMGVLLTIAIAVVYLTQKKKNKFIKNFSILTLGLVIVSYFFFASNHGWREWHTVYIAPLSLVAVLLMCYDLKNKAGKILIIIVLILSIINFKNNYLDYLKPKPDRSLLYNQEKVLDWIYMHNEGNGFNLYTYTDSFYDYSYQYLVSWYAKPKYGFYPCEYSNFPLSIKSLYIPHPENYVTPQLGCDKFRFLIVDSNTNGNENRDWLNEFRSQTIFVDKTQIGNTTIEKRKLPDKIR